MADTSELSPDVEDVLDAMYDVPEVQRDAWLAARCASDPGLRQRVDDAMRRLARVDSLLSMTTSARQKFSAQAHAAPKSGAILGAYRLGRELGRGGMGAVYLAERADGQFERQVAVKVLLPTADTRALRARFVAERQILATLSHPNIAQLLDGGMTDEGTPYLVMEYAPGEPITEYCRRRDLDTDACLELFLQVCEAVHHAHRSLVLHRDLKPANIIVTANGEVKLLDFGIAKIVTDTAHDLEVDLTRTDGRPMTPAYASPEQLRGDVLTTASDVYSVGLILYELLTGAQAYATPTGTAPTAVARHATREKEPPRPSVTAPLRARRLRGDLDAIVLMSLRYSADSRYGSVEILAADIRRSMEGLPVLAHRGSTLYRLSRVFQRHALSATLGAAALMALVVGTVVAVTQARRAERARARADAALEQSLVAQREADEVRQYLIGMFEPEDPSEGRRDTVTTVQLLARGVRRAEQLKSQPLVQAQLFDALSRVQDGLGDLNASQLLLERSLEARRRLLGSAAPLTSATEERLAEQRRRAGRYASAESLAASALRGRITAGSQRDQAASLKQLGLLAVYRGDLIAAESLVTRAVRLRYSPTAPDSIAIIALEALASIQWRRGRLAPSLATLTTALGSARQLYGYPHRIPARILLRMAESQRSDPTRIARVDSLARAAVSETETALGAMSFWTAIALDNAAQLISVRAGETDRERMLRRAIQIERRILEPHHYELMQTLLTLARELSRQKRFIAADSARLEAMSSARVRYGAEHPAFAGVLIGDAELLLDRRRIGDAERELQDAIQIRRRVFGATSMEVALATRWLAEVAAARGQWVRADSIFVAARLQMLTHTTPEHPDVAGLDSARAATRARAQAAGSGTRGGSSGMRRKAAMPPIASHAQPSGPV